MMIAYLNEHIIILYIQIFSVINENLQLMYNKFMAYIMAFAEKADREDNPGRSYCTLHYRQEEDAGACRGCGLKQLSQ
jgi:hypothetical protein